MAKNNRAPKNPPPSNKPDPYPRVVEILMSDNPINFKGMCTLLASKHPDMFIKMWEATPHQPPAVKPTQQLQQYGGSTTVLGLCKSGEKVQAIKLLRNITGLGLKESKDVVDNVFLHLAGPSTQTLNAAAVLNKDLYTLYQQIISSN
jgi:hypothetical protein